MALERLQVNPVAGQTEANIHHTGDSFLLSHRLWGRALTTPGRGAFLYFDSPREEEGSLKPLDLPVIE